MSMQSRFAVKLAGALLLMAGLPSIGASSASHTPIVVELFTSEGCSSCPPADAFLKELDTAQPSPGIEFIVMEEHVDYWDDLGWKDPFSSHELTLRQVAYTKRLNVEGPYTPEMVVDGAYEFVGNDRAHAAAAFQKAALLKKTPIRISQIKLNGGKLQAHVESESVPEEAELFAALVLGRAQSQVQHGENGGRKLEHVAVVRSLTKIGNAKTGRAFSGDISLDAGSLSEPGRVILFLQQPHHGKIIGAAVAPFQP